MSGYIYADNAATTRLDEDAFEAMKPFLLDEYANASQPYAFSRKVKQALKDAREKIAECINADADEIYFTSGGTESDNWAIREFGTPGGKKGIVTSQIEHHAILNACKMAEKAGTHVDYLPVTKDGTVIISNLPEILAKNNTDGVETLVSVMMANNEIGTIEPIAEIARIAHLYGAVLHTDAVQAVGHIPIDVKTMGIDMLSASAHKFNGPKGIGFMYIRKDTVISQHNAGGSQERGYRAGTENVAGIVAMAVALKKNCEEMNVISKQLLEYEDTLICSLSSSGEYFIRNGAQNHLPGNISLSFKDSDGEAILHRLDFNKICISTGSACDSVNTQVSHVIRAICVPNEYAEGTIRISLGRYNTIEDVETIAKTLVRIINQRGQ